MLKLIKLPTAFGVRNASAFNLKAEALMAMSGLPFETEEALPNKGPKGKLPALVDGAHTVGDSTLIQRHLESVHNIDFDANLTDIQRADAEAYRRMTEEWLYFIALYVRWIVKPDITRQAFFGGIPWPLRNLIFSRLQKAVKRTLHGQGLARHSTEEIYSFGATVIDALDARIGEGPFFFGNNLHSIDAALYPQILNITDTPYEVPLKAYARSKPNLVAYAARCDTAIFSKEAD